MAGTNISLECFGIAVSLLLLYCCLFEKPGVGRQTHLFTAMLVTNISVLFCDLLTWSLKGNAELTVLLYILNSLVYSLGYVMTALFTYYLVSYVNYGTRASRWINGVITALCLVAVLLVAVSLFNHMYFSYDNAQYSRGPLYWLSQAYPIGILLFDMVVILLSRKRIGLHDTLSLLSYGVLPIIAMLIQIKVYGITLLYIATTLSLLIVYITVHMEQSRKMQKQEMQLQQANISIMLSQIQPHFLYNALAVVQGLCRTNPALAEKTTADFAAYLRGNLDSVSAKKPVPFSQELAHTKNFLSLEMLLYTDNISVTYDIQTEEFYIPTLTLQPIAENAVKYGLKKKEHISVKISTRADVKNYYVTVQDDGEGFIVGTPLDNAKSHIGINNVRSRIESQMGGSLHIDSIPGKGTTVTITIPKERKQP